MSAEAEEHSHRAAKAALPLKKLRPVLLAVFRPGWVTRTAEEVFRVYIFDLTTPSPSAKK
eukprot:CAMPEP_0113869568 /NCGR_PEP_ID=MMETSP0780_2-20120614/1606_1 /TAXON_ID=652834 /ORGANISM="Palpitomonas bilix" /LENGTH=59 /DNA_ID=CAMNT_0000854755 /DNA_START=257 /DNA_END=433 /DNA_ORIENTATION=+ /assembly_acc=CAM_ASM_000599